MDQEFTFKSRYIARESDNTQSPKAQNRSAQTRMSEQPMPKAAKPNAAWLVKKGHIQAPYLQLAEPVTMGASETLTMDVDGNEPIVLTMHDKVRRNTTALGEPPGSLSAPGWSWGLILLRK